MRPAPAISAACLVVMLAGVPVGAAERSELDQLRQQLEIMKQEHEAQKRAIQSLEQRLRQLEAGLAADGGLPPVQRLELPPQLDGGAPVLLSATYLRSQQVQAGPEGQAPEPAVPAAPSAAEEEPVREPGPSQAVETVLQEEHALFGARRFTLEPGVTYAHFDRTQINLTGFLALDAIFLGNISVDQVDADIVTLDLTGRYGVTDRIQVDVNVPFVYRRSNFQSGGAGGASTALIEDTVSAGPKLGDVSFGINYRLLAETAARPDLVLSASAKAPTGTHPFGLELVEVPGSAGNLIIPAELPTGNGVWAASAGLSVLKTIDPVVLFANLSYVHNFVQRFNDINSAPGDQPGEVDLGDAIQYGLGIAFALNERTSVTLSYSQGFTVETRTRLDGQEFADVIGSDANSAVLNVGVTYALSEQLSIVANVGAGLTPDAADVQFSLRFPYSFDF